MEHQDGSLIRREPPERAVELIACGDHALGVGYPRSVHRQEGDLDGPKAPIPLRGPVAPSNQKSMQPGVEPLGVAEAANVEPGVDQGFLDRVLRPFLVAQDQSSCREQARDDRGGERRERLVIAGPRPLDELPLQTTSSLHWQPSGRARRVWGGVQ